MTGEARCSRGAPQVGLRRADAGVLPAGNVANSRRFDSHGRLGEASLPALINLARFVILNEVKNPVCVSWHDARAKVQMDSSLHSE